MTAGNRTAGICVSRRVRDVSIEARRRSDDIASGRLLRCGPSSQAVLRLREAAFTA